MVKEIYLMRHGLTESNKKKIYAGCNEECLSKQGKVDLFEIAKKIKKFNIEKIYSSPIRRAVQTAEIINSFMNVDIEIEKDFKEMKMGLWEGLSEYEVEEWFPDDWKIWNTRPSELKINGRETLGQLQIRSLNGIRLISENSNSMRILVVTHVAIIRVLVIYYNNWCLDEYRKIDIPNGAVYLLGNREKDKNSERVL